MSIEIKCDTCGKNIPDLGIKDVHCDYCVEDLKSTMSDLEDTIYELKEEIIKLEEGK